MSPNVMKNRVVTGSLPGIVRWAAVGVSVFVLACLVGTATAGSKSKRDTAADAKKVEKRVVVISNEGDKPFLGVTMQELDEGLRKGLDVKVTDGVLISEVVEGSPAEKAGIEDGDIIVEFNGKTVGSPSELRGLVEESDVGETVKVKVVRDNKPKTLTVTVGTYPEDASWSFAAPEHFEWFGDGKEMLAEVFSRGQLGVRVTELNEDLSPYFGVKEGEGVLVLDVTEGTPGEKMGIKAGDVIVKVNDEKVGSVAGLKEAVGELEEGDAFAVALVRSKKDVALQGEMDKTPVRMYSKMRPHKLDVRVPKFDVERIPGPEMESLKKEMKELKKELEELKEELSKVKKST